MTATRKKSINIWTIISVVVMFLGGGGFAVADRFNASVNKRIESVAERKIKECPQVQKIDTVYKMLELNALQHVEIKNAVQSLNAMLTFLNSNNPKFTEYQAAQNAPELIGPRRHRGDR
jgi:hypothetical protein